jgi:hypothetical protein
MEKQRDAVQEVNIGLRGFPQAHPKLGLVVLEFGRDAVRRISEPRRVSVGHLRASWGKFEARRDPRSQLLAARGTNWNATRSNVEYLSRLG